jgi:hypothetical protein
VLHYVFDKLQHSHIKLLFTYINLYFQKFH